MDWQTRELDRLIQECCDQQGWQLPWQAMNQMREILASYIDKPDWQPRPSLAEAYMTRSSYSELVNLGNDCWFARSIFPELIERKGLGYRYYEDIGQGAYARALQLHRTKGIELMAQHFEFLAEVAHTAIRCHGHWRSMWTL